jgi:probable F420-dependent oxidoreductase
VIAALGPRCSNLRGTKARGAHPYLTTPEHTAKARDFVGNDVFLAPEHKVVLSTDVGASPHARTRHRRLLSGLVELRQHWLRLGFSEDDVAKPGSDKLIDAMVSPMARRPRSPRT